MDRTNDSAGSGNRYSGCLIPMTISLVLVLALLIASKCFAETNYIGNAILCIAVAIGILVWSL